MDKAILAKYAAFAVQIGTGVQKGQTLMINCPVEAAYFGRICAEEAYKAGAKDVVIHYNDEKLSRVRLENASVEALEDVKPWVLRSLLDYVEGEGGACVLNIASADPEIFKGLDGEKVQTANIARRNALKPYREYTMSNRIQWSIVAIPSPSWAKKVFPDVTDEEAVEKLWDAIFSVTRMNEADPIAAWKEHIDSMNRRAKVLNDESFDAIRVTSKNGTNLTIGLADDHIWEAAGGHTQDGYAFLPNIPTEEIFTAPHKDRVNGTVYGTKPYVYNGNIIKNFSVTFENGKVISRDAEEGKEFLTSLLDTDEGARHIGEIALVPFSSPISQTGLLFYSTLFDENASCHIAFGAGYPGTVEGGATMTREELAAKGVNDSLVHDDVMIGAEDTDIVGLHKDGREVQIFKDGEWAF
jgi:Leucyl aminopeptidase (aminopeptidase T)